MESISLLRTLMVAALTSNLETYAEQELFDELMVQKPRLLNLLDVGARDQQEQHEIESGMWKVLVTLGMVFITFLIGRTVIDGGEVAVNSDFARQAIFLSQQLGCSERYIAGLLHSVMAFNPNVAPVHCLELAVAQFHQNRRHLVDCLHFLFQATEAEDSGPTYQRIASFVHSDLVLGLPLQGADSFGMRVFKAVENLDDDIVKADTARKNASSNTVVRSGQGMSTLE